jgi:hypothetical protein
MNEPPVPNNSEPIILPQPEIPPLPKSFKFEPKQVIVFVLLFIVVGVSGFLLGKQYGAANPTLPRGPEGTLRGTPTPTPTINPIADWKTYTNTRYGYTLRYPGEWEPNRGPGNLSDKELFSQRDIDFYDPTLLSEDPGSGLSISVNQLEAAGTNRKCSNLDDCFSKTFNWLTETTAINKTSSTFLGQPAIFFTYHRKTNLYTQGWKYIYFIYEENAYSIDISTNISREQTVFEIFDQILSTFRFD